VRPRSGGGGRRRAILPAAGDLYSQASFSPVGSLLFRYICSLSLFCSALDTHTQHRALGSALCWHKKKKRGRKAEEEAKAEVQADRPRASRGRDRRHQEEEEARGVLLIVITSLVLHGLAVESMPPLFSTLSPHHQTKSQPRSSSSPAADVAICAPEPVFPSAAFRSITPPHVGEKAPLLSLPHQPPLVLAAARNILSDRGFSFAVPSRAASKISGWLLTLCLPPPFSLSLRYF